MSRICLFMGGYITFVFAFVFVFVFTFVIVFVFTFLFVFTFVCLEYVYLWGGCYITHPQLTV